MEEFDLDQYISTYVGDGYIDRLLFIASQSPSHAPKALKLAITAIQQTTANTARYAELVTRLADLGAEHAIPLDTAWIEDQDKKAAARLNTLELELNHHLTSQNKEGARVTLNQLGAFYYSRGDLENSLRTYLRPRTDCVTSSQILEMYTNVVHVSMALKRFSHMSSYVAKAECVKPDEETQSKLSIYAGLSFLDRASYESAAHKFLSIKHISPELISYQDVAIYGGLCALATFSRSELKSKVIDNTGFKQFLEVTPVVQSIISDFYKSKYSSCFSNLERLCNELKLDLYLHSHTARLLSSIRHKAILQYFSPFASVQLSNMAKAFNTDVASIEKEVASIIAAGQLAAKIDSHSKILYASQTQRRQQTFQNALRLAEEYESNASTLILRVNLLKADFVVRQPRSKMRADMGQAQLFQALLGNMGMGMGMGMAMPMGI